MKENMLNKLLIVCCLVAMVSCSAKKHLAASTTAPALKKTNEDAKLDPIRAQQINFNTFSGKAKASLAINGNNNDCTLNIRIYKDKKIWVSVTALLGIEVARALITPDSIQVVNRLQGVYIRKPFSYIYKFANRQIDYTMLQALLVGNAIPQLLNDSTKIQLDNNNTTLSGNIQDLMYKLVLGSDYKVSQTDLSNQDAGQSLQVVNAFTLAGTQKVPSQINIASTARDKKIQVNLHYVKVDFNQQLEYPFNIPDSYSPEN
jgi:hypothetical protein